MTKALIKTTIVGILGTPTIFTGIVNSAAAMLTAGILSTVLIAYSPLLVATMAAAAESNSRRATGRILPCE
jgi:hypothetical protein